MAPDHDDSNDSRPPMAAAPRPARHSSECRLDGLGDEIARLSAQIQAATYQLLVLIRDFDERGGWNSGFVSCAHWLNWRTGLDLGAAREKVRVARALGDLPLLCAAMRSGEISYSKVRALTRKATPENEADLLVFAQSAPASYVERLIRGWHRVDRAAAADEAELRHESRALHLAYDEDGMVIVRGRLEAEAGEVLRKALEAANDELYADERERPVSERTPVAQRRADALVLLAESALSARMKAGPPAERYQVVVHVDEEQIGRGGSDVSGETSRLGRRAHPCAEPARDGAPREGAGLATECAEVGHDDPHGVSAETSVRETRRRPACSVGDGFVSSQTAERLACDASKVFVRHAADGSTLDVGRKTRTVPPRLRRALLDRDRRCRFPGCDSTFCDAHHIEHWAHGGATRLDNLILLCRRHHRAVHEEGFEVELRSDGEAIFLGPNGRPMPAAPPPPRRKADPIQALLDRLRREGIEIDEWTGAPPYWEGEPLDLGYALEALRLG
jgi:hypothetical protein